MGLITQTQQQYYGGNDFGGYQFISLTNVIRNFMATYVGPNKILSGVDRGDVSFHAHRAMQELSFDTFKSCKTQEIEVSPSLTMPLPQDYVNYVKITRSDSSGIEHILYPTSKTSNPTPILQNSDGDYALNAIGTLTNASPTVVLDDEYSNILVGMLVSAPNIPIGTSVIDTVTAANITTITLSANVTYTGTETLTFMPLDDSLVLQEESSVTLLGVTWAVTDDKITVASTADADSIEVGMLISDQEFPVGTTVVDINGLIITASANSIAAGAATSLTFITETKFSDTWSKYKSATPSENQNYDYQDGTYWPAEGERYGLDPQHAQVNGSFYIDCSNGIIHFSSNLSGETIILHYISDGLAQQIVCKETTVWDPERKAWVKGPITCDTNGVEPLIHKFAEEAMYKWIIYGCLSARLNVPEYIIARFKKEKFAETRKAKLRLSNIKLEEITQILRGKSKQIKH